MAPQPEKTLATYEVGGVLGRASRGFLLGEGVRSMTATDRRLIVDYGARGEATVHYASGMLVDCYPKRHSSPLKSLAFPAVCAVFLAALVREGYPVVLLAAVPALLLVASLLRNALLVCVEVRRLPDLGEDRDSNLRAALVAYGAQRRSLLAFLRRLNDAVADRNASRAGRPTGTSDEGVYEGTDHDPFEAGPFEGPWEEPYPWPDFEDEPDEEDGVWGSGATWDHPLAQLLDGERTEGEPEDNEAALLDGLELETRRRAFSPEGDDAPSGVVADLPGIESDRAELLAGDAKMAHDLSGRLLGPPFAFVLYAGDTFPHARYVASYGSADDAVCHDKCVTAVPAGAGAVSAWLSEAPIREMLPTAVRRPGRAGRLFFLAALRAIRRDAPGGPVRSWLGAFPGLGSYRPRVRARWCLQPAGAYVVRMNFYEEIGPEDFHAREGGLRDAYPPDLDWGTPSPPPAATEDQYFAYVDRSSGDVLLGDYEEASPLAEHLRDEFAERGVVSDPVVELTDPFGGPFELRGSCVLEKEGLEIDLEEEDPSAGSCAEEIGPGEEMPQTPPGVRDEHEGTVGGEGGAAGAALVPLLEREWWRRVSTAVLWEKGAFSERVVLRAEGFVSTLRRIRDVELRISDDLVPEVRKDALRAQLSELWCRRDADLSDLLSDPEALILLAAGAERECAILREVARLAVRDAGSRCDSFEMRLRLRELAELREAREADRRAP